MNNFQHELLSAKTDYQNAMNELQRKYNEKVTGIQNVFRNQFNGNQFMPNSAQQQPMPDQVNGGVPPHVQIISVLGEMKSEIAKIYEVLAEKFPAETKELTEVKTTKAKADKKQVDESTKE